MAPLQLPACPPLSGRTSSRGRESHTRQPDQQTPRVESANSRPRTSSCAGRAPTPNTPAQQRTVKKEQLLQAAQIASREKVRVEEAWEYIPGFQTLPPEDAHPAVKAAREDFNKSNVQVGDVTKSPRLLQHLQGYNLGDFFDDRGQRRYANLSMSVAAKILPGVKSNFGSTTTLKRNGAAAPPRGEKLSARAYRLATEVLQRDRDHIQQRNAHQYTQLKESQKVQTKEVQLRQQDMLFMEVQDYENYIPKDFTVDGLLPPEVSTTQEHQERKRFERMNMSLTDTTFLNRQNIRLQNWLLRYDSINKVLNQLSAWSTSAGMSPNVGFDRATFCRFIIEVGLCNEQEKLPYVWAISVFDHFARFVRACNGDPDHHDPHLIGRTAVTALVCKWDLAMLLDVILRQVFTDYDANDWPTHLHRVRDHMEAEWQRLQASEMAAAPPNTAEEPRNDESENRELNSSTVSAVMNAAAAFGPKKMGRMTTTALLHEANLNTAARAGIESSIWRRNRLISGIIVEPEVLHLVERYRDVFQQIFDCYAAQETGEHPRQKMELVNFIQFCQDFGIIPRIASMHEVLRAYRSSRCLQHPEEVSPRRQRSNENLEEQPSLSPSQRAQNGPHRGPTGGSEMQRVLSSGTFSTSTQSECTDPGEPKGSSTVGGKRGRKRGKRANQQPRHGQAEVTNEPSPVPLRRFFGLAAFVETICRIAFTYLLLQGNTVQLASSSRAKMVWLITYLYSYFVNLHKSRAKRLEHAIGSLSLPEGRQTSPSMPDEQTAEECISPYLTKLLDELSPEAFGEPPEMEWQLAVAIPKRKPKEEPEVDNTEVGTKAVTMRKHKVKHMTVDLPMKELDIQAEGSQPKVTPKRHRNLISFDGDPVKVADKVVSARRFLSNPVYSATQEEPAEGTGPQTGDTNTVEMLNASTLTAVVPSPSGAQAPTAKKKSVKLGRQRTTTAVITQDNSGKDPKGDGPLDTLVRGPPPPLRGDAFKFDDLLFKELLRPAKVTPYGALSPLARLHLARRESAGDGEWWQQGQESLEIAKDRAQNQDSSVPIGGALSLESEIVALQRDLEACGNKLGRCTLTPPPNGFFQQPCWAKSAQT